METILGLVMVVLLGRVVYSVGILCSVVYEYKRCNRKFRKTISKIIGLKFMNEDVVKALEIAQCHKRAFKAELEYIKELVAGLRELVHQILKGIDDFLKYEAWLYSLDDRIEILQIFDNLLRQMLQIYANMFKNSREGNEDIIRTFKKYNIM